MNMSSRKKQTFHWGMYPYFSVQAVLINPGQLASWFHLTDLQFLLLKGEKTNPTESALTLLPKIGS